MNLQQLIEIGGFIVLVGGLVYNAAYQRGRSEQIETNLNTKIDQHIGDNTREFNGVKNWLQRMNDWRDDHEKDVSDKRFELQRQLGKIEASVSIQDNNYSEILRLIESMSQRMGEKIDKLEKTIDNMRPK